MNLHWLVLLDQISLQRDREGIEERGHGERVGAWGIIEGRRLFQIVPSKGGNYLREAINQGTAIIWGNTVCLCWDFKLTPSESSIREVGSLTNTPHSHCIIVMLKLLCLKHFSLPWMLFEVGETEFIMNSKINLKKIS